MWNHQTDVVYSMGTWSLRFLQYGLIMLTLLAAWSHKAYFTYTMDPSKYVAYSMDSVNLRCLHNRTHQMHICLHYWPIRPTLLTVWNPSTRRCLQDVPSYCRCLQYVHIKVILFMTWTNHTYVDYNIYLSSLRCIRYGHIKPTLYCSTDTPNLRCIHYGPIKVMLFTDWIH